MISLIQCDIKTLPQATKDVAQGAHALPACKRKRVRTARAASLRITRKEGLSQQTQNGLGGARRGVGSRRLGIGIKPSRWANFLAALRARRTASAFSRVLRSDGFS